VYSFTPGCEYGQVKNAVQDLETVGARAVSEIAIIPSGHRFSASLRSIAKSSSVSFTFT
jgi:aspartokinase-like uncharacterized kinase